MKFEKRSDIEPIDPKSNPTHPPHMSKLSKKFEYQETCSYHLETKKSKQIYYSNSDLDLKSNPTHPHIPLLYKATYV
jgi:hypothetical protein